MRSACLARLAALTFACSASQALAAHVDVTARLDPAQSGPIYSWSLLIRVDPGYDMGAVDILTVGFDDFTPNAANPGIGILDTAYNNQDPLGDGRNLLVLNNVANGVAISTPGQTVLLGTFYGPYRASPPVRLDDCDVVCGGTVFDTFLVQRPTGELSLTAYPHAAFALRVVPEPGIEAALGSCGLLGVLALRRRAAQLARA